MCCLNHQAYGFLLYGACYVIAAQAKTEAKPKYIFPVVHYMFSFVHFFHAVTQCGAYFPTLISAYLMWASLNILA